MLNRTQLLSRAQTGYRENRTLDFKSRFAADSPADWCELIKDVIALSNSGGSVIVIGLNDDGTPSGFDVGAILGIDGADIVNRIQRYTGFQFAEFEVLRLTRDGQDVAAILVFGSDVPISFVKPGTYAVEDGRQKTAFSQGTVYFRHGAKSEPGTRDDFARWLSQQLAAREKELLQGMRQVVEAPRGSALHVTQPANPGGPLNARLGNDPNAPMVRLQNPEEVFPYRQLDVLRLVNESLPDGFRMSSHDVLCLRTVHNISPSTQPTMVFKPHSKASPQYSPDFVQWVIQEFEANPQLFSQAREAYRDGNR